MILSLQIIFRNMDCSEPVESRIWGRIILKRSATAARLKPRKSQQWPPERPVHFSWCECPG